jgi:hypothetical protein
LARGVRGLLALGAAALGACASRSVPPPAPPPETAYDWRGLMIMPFGTLLKDSPLALHEVLLFQDAAQAGDDARHRDCYAPAGGPPPFFGRRPEEYLLCFSHDRLVLVDAAVRLPGQSAAESFAAACAQWRGTRVSSGQTPGCEGRDGMTRFSAHLAAEPWSGEPAPARLSISLFAAGEPQ